MVNLKMWMQWFAITVTWLLFPDSAMPVGFGDSSQPVFAAETTGKVEASGSSGRSAAVHSFRIYINIERPVLTLFEDGRPVRSYPVALGKSETQTPVGDWKIVNKQKNWGKGFGTRWMGLNVPWGTYGIHGTNRPESIGTYSSNGCIRMNNADVERLYDIVPNGTPVRIVGDPLKYIRTLVHGNIGADVQVVQNRLKELGYFRGPCDGKFGPTTQFALIYYELAEGLPMDGEVGMDDYKALGLVQIH